MELERLNKMVTFVLGGGPRPETLGSGAATALHPQGRSGAARREDDRGRRGSTLGG